MVFENIEKLKDQWTDKYVVTDESRPELKRFSGLTGTVKTVNMSGRCLVEFDGRANIGWYDIDPGFLKVIPEPLKKPEVKEAKAAPKADAKKPATETAKAAAPAAKGGGNVADILAAARGGAKPAAAPSKPAGSSTADILAAARGKATAAPKAESPPTEAPKSPAPTKTDAKSMSVNDILAAARGKASAAAPAAPPAKAETPRPAPSPAPAPAATTPEPVVAEAAPSSAGGGSKKGAFKTVDEIVAYCRQADNQA